MKTQDIRNMGLAYLKVQEGNTAVNKQDQDGADKKEEVELDEAGSYRDQGAQNMMKASRKADKEADKVRAQRDKDEAKKKKEETAVKKLTKEDTAEWPIFARIQEKLSYKVSGVGDDPHEIIVKFAKDQHTKGATPGEKIDSKASSGEKDFVKLHGGLMGNPSTVDGHKAAAHTASAATAGIKTSPGRPGDSKIGDKNIPKSGGNK